MRSIKKLTVAALAAVSLMGLSACQDSQARPKNAAQSEASPAINAAALYDEVAAKGKGFTVGQMMSTRTVYVMFDPQCPHCSILWKEAEPLLNEAKFTWVPVAFINAKSRLQGAKLISAKDPLAAMNEHEKTLTTSGGIDVSNPDKEALDQVGSNTALFAKSGARSVPFMIIKDAKGNTITQAGGLPTEVLRRVLNGEPVPAEYIR